MSDDWKNGDPFADPQDPAALEREQRRLEREEKRRKREAKRSEKEAAKQRPPAPEPPAEPPPPPRTPEQEFWDEDPEPIETPSADPSEPKSKSTEPVPPKSEPRAAESRAEAPSAAAAAGAAAASAADPTPTPAPEQPIEQSWEAEPPPPPDADIWGDEGDPAKVRAGGRGRRAGRGGDGGRGGGAATAIGRLRRHPFRIAGVIVLVLIAWFLIALFQPFHGDGSGQVQVQVPKGSSVSEVGDLLGEKGVIDSSTLFQIRVTLEGKRSSLYAGSFTLAKGMSYGDAIEALSTPPVKRVTTVTIPEGYTRSQAAQLVEEDGVPGSYTKKTIKSKYLDPADYGGKGGKDLEGFLFPNTFELKPKAPVADLVELQLKDFKRQIKKVDLGFAKSKNLTVFDVLIIASMIEREAGIAKQRKLVASVIYNRLKDGMPLGIDATIRFATGNYTKPLTESELGIDSPYNTRENVGLPPGPINSPGLDGIQAAAHPAKSDFIFYVNKPNTCGVLAFSATEDEFEADVAAYNKAREANGGNEPTTCGE
ncbi:MAG: endolytic transglycosylase MltG [Thermoleophilia bacterium]|nr:endolytic transglycosylase MltG [Thermoleophilia bacterium]